MNQEELKSQVIKSCIENNFQISKQALDKILEKTDPVSVANKLIDNLKNTQTSLILPIHLNEPEQIPELQILKNYNQNYSISGIEDMAAYFMKRLESFKKQLQNRLPNLVSINHAKNAGREKISFLAIISSKRKTEKGNFIFELEDFSGRIKAIASKEPLLTESESIVNDDVLGFTGSMGDGVFFVNEFTWPDMPIKETTSSIKTDAHALFLSDIHVGSKEFLKQRFQVMLDWLNGKLDEEKYPIELIDKIKYIFIAGDLVDGVGVYPTQFNDLTIPDIYEQYKEAAKLLSQIPERIKTIISPGNHDYVRLAHPQPVIPREIAPELHELTNIEMVSNPSIIKIEANGGSGLNVLTYHGTSMDNLVKADPNLKDGYKHPEKVMVAMLKRRHLCPQYDAGIVPQPNHGDPLMIPPDIDIFQTGHVHSNGALNYRGVTLINGGTWQDKTEFQRFLGHEPTPCRLVALNLKNRQVTQIHF